MLKDAHVNAFIEGGNYGDPLLLVEDMNLDVLQVDDHIVRVVVVPFGWLKELIVHHARLLHI